MCKLGDTSTKKVEVLPVEVLPVEVTPSRSIACISKSGRSNA